MKNVPLVLIHGFPLDHRMWLPVQRNLPAGLIVLTPDLPGFGNTESSPESGSMDAYAQHLSDWLETNGASEIVLAGTSMGGYVALAFAERYPNRIRGLALVDSQASGDNPETITKRNEQIDDIRRGNLEKVVSQLLPKLFSPTASVHFHEYARECANNANPDGLIHALEAMAHRPDRTDFLLKGCAYPVVIIHATHDQVIPLDKARTLVQSVPRSTFTEVPGGHTSPMESPLEVAQALNDLVAKSTAGGKTESGPKQYQLGFVCSPTDHGL